MRVVLFSIIYCSLVHGQCHFRSDKKNENFINTMKNWKINQQVLTVSSNELTYSIGICVSLDNNNTAIIQKGTSSSYVLGKLDRVNLVGGDNWILLTYENGDQYDNICNNATRSASIMFVCGANMKNMTILQESKNTDELCNYMFQLQVPEMCPPQEKKKLSGGAIFLIILFSLATAYLVVGAVFMHIKRGARGIDHIPNLEMWRKLGQLSADGCDFCCRCERASPRAGYFFDESGGDLHGDDDILSP